MSATDRRTIAEATSLTGALMAWWKSIDHITGGSQPAAECVVVAKRIERVLAGEGDGQ